MRVKELRGRKEDARTKASLRMKRLKPKLVKAEKIRTKAGMRRR